MDIGEAFRFIEYLANKSGNGGYIKPSDRTMLAQRAEYEFVSPNYNNVKDYSKGNKNPLYGYGDSQRVNDNLGPYMKSVALAPDSGGKVDLPADYLHPTGFFATYRYNTTQTEESLDCGMYSKPVLTGMTKNVEVKILLPDTFNSRLSSPTTPPTLEYPISTREGKSIIIAPYNTYLPVFHYIRKPAGAVYAYSGTDQDFIYDSSSSRTWEAPDDCHSELCYLILGYIGIHVRDDMAAAYSNFKMQKGS